MQEIDRWIDDGQTDGWMDGEIDREGQRDTHKEKEVYCNNISSLRLTDRETVRQRD